ncbi:MAG: glycosyltransferase [Acidimicrobiia bacterium]
MNALHQFLPDFAAGDAIGNHVVGIRDTLRQAGYDSEIFADDIKPAVRHLARHYREFTPPPPGSPVWLLYHLSTASPMAEWLARSPTPLAVAYHNITPAGYFRRWMPDAEEGLRTARSELQMLASPTRFALAVSNYNAGELTAAGYRNVSVVPLLIDFSDYDAPPDPRAAERLARMAEGGGTRWLTVGRCSPHKGLHHLLAAFAIYRRIFDPRAHLAVVGHRTVGAYARRLERMADELGVADAVELPGTLPFPELVAEFRAAGVYVSLSEHEGFCAPLLEAMHFGVPVVALARAAVPETAGDAALLLDSNDPMVVAAAVHRVVTDAPLARRLADAGRARLERFSLENSRRRLLEAVSSRLAAPV